MDKNVNPSTSSKSVSSPSSISKNENSDIIIKELATEHKINPIKNFVSSKFPNKKRNTFLQMLLEMEKGHIKEVKKFMDFIFLFLSPHFSRTLTFFRFVMILSRSLYRCKILPNIATEKTGRGKN